MTVKKKERSEGFVEFNRSHFVVAGLATHGNSLFSKCDV